MPSHPEGHRRRSIRLPDYDYSQTGAYFVTIVCKNRALLLDNQTYRDVVEEAWRWLASHHAHVTLDEYVLMPNHLHGVLLINSPRRGGSRTAPTEPAQNKPLGRLIGAFKTVSTKKINALRSTPGEQVWQRNYYERIIRNEDELNRIRTYIQENPLHWEEDPENPLVSHKSETTRVQIP